MTLKAKVWMCQLCHHTEPFNLAGYNNMTKHLNQKHPGQIGAGNIVQSTERTSP